MKRTRTIRGILGWYAQRTRDGGLTWHNIGGPCATRAEALAMLGRTK